MTSANRLPGDSMCPNCNKPVPANSTYCPSCGQVHVAPSGYYAGEPTLTGGWSSQTTVGFGQDTGTPQALGAAPTPYGAYAAAMPVSAAGVVALQKKRRPV